MKRFLNTIYILPLMFLYSCNTNITDNDPQQKLVVQGYLISGEPVQNIQLSTTFSLSSTDSVAPPVNDAIVSIIKDQTWYPLANTGENGYYHYIGNELTVTPGDIFGLEVRYQNEVITAQTLVPAIPQNASFPSSSTMIITENDPDTTPIKLEWEHQTSTELFYIVIIENIDRNPEEIVLHRDSNLITDRGTFIRGGENLSVLPASGKSIPRQPTIEPLNTFISFPTADKAFEITPTELSHTGKHYARVYGINQEYADLYISQQQQANNLNATLTNVQNGLGIFTAFSSSDSLFFRVRQK